MGKRTSASKTAIPAPVSACRSGGVRSGVSTSTRSTGSSRIERSGTGVCLEAPSARAASASRARMKKYGTRRRSRARKERPS